MWTNNVPSGITMHRSIKLFCVVALFALAQYFYNFKHFMAADDLKVPAMEYVAGERGIKISGEKGMDERNVDAAAASPKHVAPYHSDDDATIDDGDDDSAYGDDDSSYDDDPKPWERISDDSGDNISHVDLLAMHARRLDDGRDDDTDDSYPGYTDEDDNDGDEDYDEDEEVFRGLNKSNKDDDDDDDDDDDIDENEEMFRRLDVDVDDILRAKEIRDIVHKNGNQNDNIETMNRDADIINPFPFRPVLIPTDPCADPNLYVFIFIYTAPRNHKDRQLLRDTWLNTKLYEDTMGTKVGYLFFMGLEENATSPNDDVIKENALYDDIYVEDYVDSYFNLTRKGIAGMRYAYEHCQNVRRVVRSDDDVLIDVFHLIQFFHSEDPDFTTGAFLCRPQPNDPLRDPGSKWYVSWEEWPYETYPKVCNGFVYIMSPDVCGLLFKTSLTVPYFKFEDVYITGSLMEAANVSKFNIGHFYDGKMPRFSDALHAVSPDQDFPYMFTLTHKSTEEEVKELWDFITAKYMH